MSTNIYISIYSYFVLEPMVDDSEGTVFELLPRCHHRLFMQIIMYMHGLSSKTLQ